MTVLAVALLAGPETALDALTYTLAGLAFAALIFVFFMATLMNKFEDREPVE